MSASPKRRGRPPKAGAPATERIEVRTTAARKARLAALAEAAGVSQSAWVERAIDRARLRPYRASPSPDGRTT